MPRCCGQFWYPKPYDPSTRKCPECGSIPGSLRHSERRVITVDADTYAQLERQKGDRTWEEFLTSRASPEVGSQALSD